MSGRVDLKTHMNKSSIKELIKYIEAAGMTPSTCNGIYTIARGIQYMDDTYLREYTTEKLRSLKADKSKTPVPYNEWIKCMFKPTEETRISDINGLSCETKKCRKSEGLGSCLPKSRMLKDPLSKKDINDLKILSTAIMEKKIDELNNIIPFGEKGYITFPPHIESQYAIKRKQQQQEKLKPQIRKQQHSKRGGRKTRKGKRRASTKKHKKRTKHKKRASTKKHKKYIRKIRKCLVQENVNAFI